MLVVIEELRAEYRDRTMGPKIVDRVRELVRQKLSRRDPQIYAAGAFDYRDGVEDVLHGFVIDVLLGEGQLAYFFATASSADEFDRLTNFQLNRYLARTRQRTIVDNLLSRALSVLQADELVDVLGSGGDERFARNGMGGASVIDERSVRSAAAVGANSVPRIFTNPDERNPKVYSDSDLRTLLRIFLAEMGCAVTRKELQELFEILLTPWITTVLGLDEAMDERPGDIAPHEQSLVDGLATDIAARWTEEDVIVFRYRLANKSDTQLAERLGVSRPTAANAKRRLYERLRTELEDLDVQLRPMVLTRLATLTDGVVG